MLKNKSAIIFLTVVISILCIYYLSFTFISKGIQQDAIQYAKGPDGKVNLEKKQDYLDSLWNRTAFTMMGINYTYQDITKHELKLGLDLQGGMHITMEVSPVGIIRAMAGNVDDENFEKAIKMAKEKRSNSEKKFTRLFYESYKELDPDIKLSTIFSSAAREDINYKTSNEQVLSVINEEVNNAIERVFNILRTRIDQFGVTQPNIQREKGTGRIQIELPGIDNPVRARELLQATAKLEFFKVYNMREFQRHYMEVHRYLAKQQEMKEKQNKGKRDTAGSREKESVDDLFASDSEEEKKDTSVKNKKENDQSEEESLIADEEEGKEEDTALAKGDTGKKDTAQNYANTQTKLTNLIQMMRNVPYLVVNIKDTSKAMELLQRPKVQSMLPPNLEFFWGDKVQEMRGEKYLPLYPLQVKRNGKPLLGGDVVEDAGASISREGKGYQVNMEMNSDGTRKWKKITGEYKGNFVAIVLDDIVYSAPRINQQITGGRSSITGDFKAEEAKFLANILKAGKMPAPTRIVQESVVGPSLGEVSIRKGLTSTIAGLILVVLFMVLYYNYSGAIADITLLINLFFIIGILASLNAALTLPGIAGIVLTIGMSVDANVLIFERIKEELKLGKTHVSAISNGYKRAYWSIFDANVTTLIIAIILAYFGSGPVKGFATTLIIGIVTSFFSAVFITRVIIETIVNKRPSKTFEFTTFLSKGLFKNVNLGLIHKRKTAYVASSIVIGIGIISMILQGGLNLGVDFKGGRSYVVGFDEPMVSSEVKGKLKDDFNNEAIDVKTFGDDKRLKITTSYLIDDESSEADKKVKNVLLQGLNKSYGNLNPTIMSSAKVGPTIADDIKNASMTSIVIALVALFIFILMRFRRWQFSTGAVLALFHDVLIVLSMVAIVRWFGFAIEVDQVFIAAMLTLIGYSINDTVVVFDRIREFVGYSNKIDMEYSINNAINHTISRTVMTSFTTLLVIVILLAFGGQVLKGFSFVLLVGVLVGTYSSMFIASPAVLDLSKNKKPTPESTGKKMEDAPKQTGS